MKTDHCGACAPLEHGLLFRSFFLQHLDRVVDGSEYPRAKLYLLKEGHLVPGRDCVQVQVADRVKGPVKTHENVAVGGAAIRKNLKRLYSVKPRVM
jgi:hypothetical protein